MEKIKVDKIIKNAKIYTANKDNLHADSLAIKDGKFIYVGNEAGLSSYEGETLDLNGKFIMPSIIDGHVHVPFSVAFDYAPKSIFITCTGKSNILEFVKKSISENPNQDSFVFAMPHHMLNGEKLTKQELDSVSSDKEVQIIELEGHSVWANTKVMLKYGIKDDTPDIVPGLSTYERDENGKTSGYMIEMAAADILVGHANNITDEQIVSSLNRFFDFCKEYGVSTVLDAGSPGADAFHERVYKILCDLDNEGKLPITFEGCYIAYRPDLLENAIENLIRYRKTYNTKHVKVNTLKVISDGTVGINTAALLEPYADKPEAYGGCLFDNFDLVKLLKDMNDNNFNFHCHTVGERAVKQVLDATEAVKKELGDKFKIKVTCAHIEIAKEEDLKRFGKLGVYADFTPWWNGGGCGGDGVKGQIEKLGEVRGRNKLRCKTVSNTGALVGYSSDNIMFTDFVTWNPYLGIELGMTRLACDKTRISDNEKLNVIFPPENECMTIDEMLLGYTSINAKILGLDNKGSIEVGKDADYLVFDKDLTTAEKAGFSNNLPLEVYFEGKRYI